jgi:peptide deformylase
MQNNIITDQLNLIKLKREFMIKEILTYPNPILKKKSVEVKEFNEELHVILDDMIQTMDSKEGIGLAGVQIGVLLRILVLRIPDSKTGKMPETPLEIINPEIKNQTGEVIYSEGCLSIPEYYEDVKRAETIEITYYDRNGIKHDKTFDGLDSIAIQHEIDHLNGKVFVERLSYIKRKKFEKEWKNQNKKNKRAN